MAVDTVIGGQPTLELLAGQHPNGDMVVERVLISPQPEAHSYLLLKSKHLNQ